MECTYFCETDKKESANIFMGRMEYIKMVPHSTIFSHPLLCTFLKTRDEFKLDSNEGSMDFFGTTQILNIIDKVIDRNKK